MNGWESKTRVPVVDGREESRPAERERSALGTVRAMVGMLLADPEPTLAVECLALVTGIGFNGATPAEVAKRHRTSTSKVYARCRDICEALGIPRPTEIPAARPRKVMKARGDVNRFSRQCLASKAG